MRWESPAVDAQDTLGDLIRRYEEYGLGRMVREVFRIRSRSPGTKLANVRGVLHVAVALHAVGIEVLQDVHSARPEEIEKPLHSVAGVGARTVRLLMMYAGHDDFVRGDLPVRRFVASALGRRSVSAVEAERLVRQAAYELILSPRFLDSVIWEYGVSGSGMARPPEPPPEN